MQNRKLHRFLYTARHQYLTMNNIVLAVAAVIAISWAWASVEAVQKNYLLQREVDGKKRQQQLIQLETENLQYEQRYYQSREYLQLEAKRRLGLAEPGEKLLVLPPNSEAVKLADKQAAESKVVVAELPQLPPFQQWMDFLFGVRKDALQKSE